ncbi:flagellar assembly protein FliW [Microbacterium sp. 1.5R]|uniref:flagellar assembly protein FliW n=1 Tax=Microbacterium sp. 1.5R TaxID=1916917 RepID=UPI0011A7BD39|nr:flagellar assembly protein FliW [Microbacterium sp. 1.5R]
MTAITADTAAFAVEFVVPMPGLRPHTSFALEPIAGAEGLYALRATDADVRLFLLDPVFNDFPYAPRISSGVRSDLGVGDADDLRLLIVANPSDDGVFVNLRAPIVIDPATGRAAQVILDDEDYPIRVRLDD